jgi:NAD(P)-dependent dehydrogenase (short-subunit alcohol dehydrogenase family)
MSGPTGPPMFDLTGRVALVTGAGQGVGVGIAAALASRGAAIAVNDLHPDRAERTAARLRADGSRALAVAFDIRSTDAIAAGVAAVESGLGPVDVLVNNAGVPIEMGIAPILDGDPGEWAPLVDTNFYGSLHCIRAVAPGMVDRGWGRIVQISSAAGSVGIRLGVGVYGGAKAGIEGALRHLAVELGRTGVTVNSLALGLMGNVDDPTTLQLARGVPVGRLGLPADAGAAVVYLASPEASWITGQTIHLDGGATTG